MDIDQYNSSATTCRPLETGPWTQSSWTSEATAHAGYAMMMNSSKFENIDNYSYNNDNNNNNAVYFIADRMQ